LLQEFLELQVWAGSSNRPGRLAGSCASMLQEFLPENLESLDLGWNPIDEKGFEAWEGLRVAGSSMRWVVAQKLQKLLRY